MKTKKMIFSTDQYLTKPWRRVIFLRNIYRLFSQLSPQDRHPSGINQETNKLPDVDQITFNGKVIDAESKEKLIGASIVITGNRYFLSGTSTDVDGNFQLRIDRNRMSMKGWVEVSYTGYATRRIAIEELKSSATIALQAGGELSEWLNN